MHCEKSVWDEIAVDYHWHFTYRHQSLKFLHDICYYPTWWALLLVNADTSMKHKEEILYLLSITAEVPWGMQKTFSTEYKKRVFSQGTNCHILKEYSDSRLIMFSINCFILLGNVPSYSERVFPSIFQHVGSIIW